MSTVLRIVSGDPTPAEIAAVTVALLSGGDAGGGADGQGSAAGRPVAGGWADRQSLQRVPLRPGPGGWRAQAR